jgi:CBS domain-containing protein
MAKKIRDVMSRKPVTLRLEDTVHSAAEAMKENDIGDVLVIDSENKIAGIVTDRDITVRAIAEGKDPSTTQLSDVCSSNIATIGPDAAVSEAVNIMRERAVRRLPVIDGDTPVGFVSIGDLAIERDERSALADISAAPSNE